MTTANPRVKSRTTLIREAAVEAATRWGFRILPLNRNKVARMANWPHTATADPEIVSQFPWHRANIGLACGYESGVFAVDVDGEAGDTWIQEFDLPDTATCITARGYHLIYKWAPGLKNKPGVVPKIDLRTDGGLVVLPPSDHKSGHTYRWKIDPDTIAEAPPELLRELRRLLNANEVIKDPKKYSEQVLKRGLHDIEKAEEGYRNSSLNNVAFALAVPVEMGFLDRDEVEGQLEAAALAKGLDSREALATIRSGLDSRGRHDLRERLEQAQARPPIVSGPPAHSIEFLAEEHLRRHPTEWLYVADDGQWLRWDEATWRAHKGDTTAEIDIRNAVRAMCREYGTEQEEYSPKVARQLCHPATWKSVVEALRDQCSVLSTSLDVEDWLLGTPGGVVDLRTMGIRPARPEDRISMTTAVAPSFEPPIGWIATLHDCLPDPDVVEYLQNYLGYALSGDMRLQQFVMFHGVGANGKGVVIDVVRGVLGEYAETVNMDVFIKPKGDIHLSRLTDLDGPRLVVAEEPDPRAVFNEAVIKGVTGEGLISANKMHGNRFKFAPKCKIVLVGNDVPAMHGLGNSMKRRMRIVRFPKVFTNPDTGLRTRLREEWPQILGWLIQGAHRVYKTHVSIPAPRDVEFTTEDYFEEQDIVAEFLNDSGDFSPNSETPTLDIYKAWERWAVNRGHQPGNIGWLGRKLSKIPGIKPYRTKYSRGWLGYRLGHR